MMLGRLTDALEAGREALPLVEAAGHPPMRLAALRDISYIHALRGTLTASWESIECASVVAARMGASGPVAYTLAQRAWVAFLHGDWPGARSALDEAVAMGRQGQPSWYSSYPLIFHDRLSLARGAWAEAAVSLGEALALAERNDDLQGRRWAAGAMAELDILEGRAAAATARLAPLLDRPSLEECDATTLLPVLAWAYLEQGQVDEAAVVVGRALTRARREDMRLVRTEALRVELRRAEWAAAARPEDEVALARDISYPYAEARLLHADGRRYAALGEPALARERLATALTIFPSRLAGRT